MGLAGLFPALKGGVTSNIAFQANISLFLRLTRERNRAFAYFLMFCNNL